mmetsp:Transcript_110891/g.192254  ORF Transcript_110891/g.192254 Transcript_110891/m.192254 type:complete len:207 (-) Transcript_110891:381-1001(-)
MPFRHWATPSQTQTANLLPVVRRKAPRAMPSLRLLESLTVKMAPSPQEEPLLHSTSLHQKLVGAQQKYTNHASTKPHLKTLTICFATAGLPDTLQQGPPSYQCLARLESHDLRVLQTPRIVPTPLGSRSHERARGTRFHGYQRCLVAPRSGPNQTCMRSKAFQQRIASPHLGKLVRLSVASPSHEGALGNLPDPHVEPPGALSAWK